MVFITAQNRSKLHELIGRYVSIRSKEIEEYDRNYANDKSRELEDDIGEIYKWLLLPKMNDAVRKLNEDNITTVVYQICSTNKDAFHPSKGEWAYRYFRDALVTFAKKDPHKTYKFLRVLFEETKPLSDRIDTAIILIGNSLSKHSPQAKLDIRNISFLLAAKNYKKYPMFKAREFEGIGGKEPKIGFLRAIDVKTDEFENTTTIGQKYELYQSFCFEVLKELKNNDSIKKLKENQVLLKQCPAYKDTTMLDVQDLIYIIGGESPESISVSSTSIEQEHKNRFALPQSELNRILYGPPGTGKTYSTRKRAVELIVTSAETGPVSEPPPPVDQPTKKEWVDEIKQAFSKANRIWKISPGEKEKYYNGLLIKWELAQVIAIGLWCDNDKDRDLAGKTLPEIKSLAVYEGKKHPGNALQVYRFINEMKIGDVVVVYSDEKIRAITEVTSDYMYKANGAWYFIEKNYNEADLKVELLQEIGVEEKNLPDWLAFLRDVEFTHCREVDYLVTFTTIDDGIEVKSQKELYNKLSLNGALFDISKFRNEIQKLVVEKIEKEAGD